MLDGKQPEPEPIFDLQVAHERIPGGAEGFDELAAVMVAEVPLLVVQIRSALVSRDVENLRRHAHSLAGSAEIFGCAAVANAARQLYRAAEVRDYVAGEGILTELEVLVERLVREIEAAIGHEEAGALARPARTEVTTVLVVDDSALDRRLAGRCVEAVGLEALYASSALEALDLVETDPPDIVLTDLKMPDMDGLELVNRMRRAHPRVPVVLMTAYGSEDTAVSALRAGAASYVPKKDLRRELKEALRPVLVAVEGRHQGERVRGLLERAEWRFELGNAPEASMALVGFLRNSLEQVRFCDEAGLFQVSTALAEALSNAVDHGNLELDSAIRESDDSEYAKLRGERWKQNPFKDRHVHVTARLTPEDVTYVIRDEGSGFDPTSLPDPRDPENLLKSSGRGIMLIRTFMDDVRFNKTGNEITMIKRKC